MYDPAEPIRFASVNAAIDHFRSELPLVRIVLKEMERIGDDRKKPDLYRRTKAIAAMLEDPDLLREKLDKMKAPDGTVTFRFTPDAADFLRNAQHQR